MTAESCRRHHWSASLPCPYCAVDASAEDYWDMVRFLNRTRRTRSPFCVWELLEDAG